LSEKTTNSLPLSLALVLLFISLSISTSCVASTLQPANRLFDLMNQRFSMMKSVAAYKWQHRLPPYAPKREQLVLKMATTAAVRQGLAAKPIRQFFQLQMNASVVIEQRWIRYWQRHGFPKNFLAPNLKTQIRPDLTHLGNQIVIQLKRALPVLRQSRYRRQLRRSIYRRITVRFVSKSTKYRLLQSLMNL